MIYHSYIKTKKDKLFSKAARKAADIIYMRKDIHCPKNIIPEDYEFVALGYTGAIDVLEDAEMIQHNRLLREAHMKQTGGKFSNHEHGGNCDCCGAHCLYDVIFYHKKSNDYIRVGTTCAEKLDMSVDQEGANLFRASVRASLKLSKGKAAAKAKLEALNIPQAWEIYQQNKHNVKNIEILNNLVSNLIKYGNLSEKQENFLVTITDRIVNSEKYEAEAAAKKASTPDCIEGRQAFTGKVISIKEVDSVYGKNLKVLLEAQEGYRVYGTLPRNLYDAKPGNVLTFTATFIKSDKDRTFGFFSRPTKAGIVEAVISQ